MRKKKIPTKASSRETTDPQSKVTTSTTKKKVLKSKRPSTKSKTKPY
jgi:hypothetical protein